jgi:arginine deiminase
MEAMTMSLLPPYQIDRRQFLIAAGGLAVAANAPGASYALSQTFLASETGTLRRALVHSATAADFAGVADQSNPIWQQTVDDIIAQHADMVLQLESAGTRVLRLDDVLETAIEAAKAQGAWGTQSGTLFPDLNAKSESAAMLLGRESSGADSNTANRSMHGLSYVRDFAVLLPKGLVLCNVADRTRSRQSAVFRFMVAFAPAFRGYPVLFDAAASGLHAEGGDIQILDANTLLVGVGNHTDARVATRLARHTGMDVVAVHIRNADTAHWNIDYDPLRDFYFHLNTSVAQIAPGHVLALPWLFETEHSGPSTLRRRDPLIADFGRVRKYRATSGELDRSVEGLKLVDYLRQRRFEVTYTGDAQAPDLEHWLVDAVPRGVILPRRERQAANMLATAPGAMLAFSGAEQTHCALRTYGVRVSAVAGPDVRIV